MLPFHQGVHGKTKTQKEPSCSSGKVRRCEKVLKCETMPIPSQGPLTVLRVLSNLITAKGLRYRRQWHCRLFLSLLVRNGDWRFCTSKKVYRGGIRTLFRISGLILIFVIATSSPCGLLAEEERRRHDAVQYDIRRQFRNLMLRVDSKSSNGDADSLPLNFWLCKARSSALQTHCGGMHEARR